MVFEFCSFGPDCGYFSECYKCTWLFLVKHRSVAQQLFTDLGIQIVDVWMIVLAGCSKCLRKLRFGFSICYPLPWSDCLHSIDQVSSK